MKLIGYFVGFWMLINGAMTTASPRWWTDTTIHAAESVLPPEQASVLDEFTTLSPMATRYYGVMESAIGLFMLALASRIRR